MKKIQIIDTPVDIHLNTDSSYLGKEPVTSKTRTLKKSGELDFKMPQYRFIGNYKIPQYQFIENYKNNSIPVCRELGKIPQNGLNKIITDPNLT